MMKEGQATQADEVNLRSGPRGAAGREASCFVLVPLLGQLRQVDAQRLTSNETRTG